MVKYYGRARQRTGSVNRVQSGLKMSGCPATMGMRLSSVRAVQKKVNCNIRVGCVDPVTQTMTGRMRRYFNHQPPTCVSNANTGFVLRAAAPKSRQAAGGIYLLSGTWRNYANS